MSPRRRLDARIVTAAAAKGVRLRFAPSFVLALCGFGGGVVGHAAAGATGLVIGALCGVVAPCAALRVVPDRAEARRDAQVPEFLEAVARSLRTGRSLVGAVGAAAAEVPEPLAADIRALWVRVEAGVAVRDALAGAASATTSAPLRTALAAVAIANEAGGAHAMVFDALAASLRSRAVIGRELRAITTPVRASALLIALAPPSVFGAVLAFDRATAMRAFSTSVGRLAAVVGVLLDLVGLWWIRTLTRVAP